ncbi:MAG TPA: hypothetical protein P5572_19025 [Phycisphaerae bacterium]|nr:hypothetical protein [Phycisphaerales bacterium]HRX87124.1 hypothetical protein [Phycisphaerae bacterium]
MLHYTDTGGYKAISSQVTWLFRASTPPGGRRRGAYFTTLKPTTRNLAARLRIPREKTTHVFAFCGNEGLRPIEGGRGQYIFWSSNDYAVEAHRQEFHGLSEEHHD